MLACRKAPHLASIWQGEATFRDLQGAKQEPLGRLLGSTAWKGHAAVAVALGTAVAVAVAVAAAVSVAVARTVAVTVAVAVAVAVALAIAVGVAFIGHSGKPHHKCCLPACEEQATNGPQHVLVRMCLQCS